MRMQRKKKLNIGTLSTAPSKLCAKIVRLVKDDPVQHKAEVVSHGTAVKAISSFGGKEDDTIDTAERRKMENRFSHSSRSLSHQVATKGEREGENNNMATTWKQEPFSIQKRKASFLLCLQDSTRCEKNAERRNLKRVILPEDSK